MPAANKVLVHRWFEEVWNKKREAAIHEMLREDALVYGLAEKPNEAIRGPEGFLPFWRKFISAIPDVSVALQSVLVEGDKVAVRCSVTGTYSGKGFGLEATNARISFTGMAILQVKDGKFSEGWNNFDFLSLYQQLGLISIKSPIDLNTDTK